MEGPSIVAGEHQYSSVLVRRSQRIETLVLGLGHTRR